LRGYIGVVIPHNSDLVYVSFSAEINKNTTENLIKVMADCANQQVQRVCILFTTSGGSVMHGLNLYNILKGMPFELTTHNVGNVDSIGNAIFLAGEKRYATASATFMFHGVGVTTSQNQRFDEKNLKENLDRVLNDQIRMGSIISQHTNLSEKEIAGLFTEAQTKDAQYALDKTIIHEIREVQIPAGCPIIPLVFER